MVLAGSAEAETGSVPHPVAHGCTVSGETRSQLVLIGALCRSAAISR